MGSRGNSLKSSLSAVLDTVNPSRVLFARKDLPFSRGLRCWGESPDSRQQGAFEGFKQGEPSPVFACGKPPDQHPSPSEELFCLPENLDLIDKSGGVGMEGRRQGKRNTVVGFL